MKGEQLALAVQLPQAPTLDNFFAGPNGDAVAGVRALLARRGASQVLIWGAPGTGKTHLLRAAAAADPGGVCVSLRGADPDWVAVREADFLAIDDLDSLGDGERPAGHAAEIALLRLLDARRAAGRPLLAAATAPPSRLPIATADLRTRLSAMLALGLRPLHDADRRELLRVQARERGLQLADDVAHWLLAHFARDAGTLIGVLEELDRAALSARRRLTLPFVQGVLQPSPARESGRTSPD